MTQKERLEIIKSIILDKNVGVSILGIKYVPRLSGRRLIEVSQLPIDDIEQIEKIALSIMPSQECVEYHQSMFYFILFTTLGSAFLLAFNLFFGIAVTMYIIAWYFGINLKDK